MMIDFPPRSGRVLLFMAALACGLAAPAATPYTQQVLAGAPIAYWRLDEIDGALIAHDLTGGHDCAYTNTVLGAAGYNSGDPDTAAGFGLLTASNSCAREIDNADGGISRINFSAPMGASVSFSVEAWVNATGATQNYSAGIVSKGYLGGEQFNLDEGVPGYPLRFGVRNSLGSYYSAYSAFDLHANPGWHHVVGVCDEAAGQVLIYVDGTLSGSNQIPVNSGIFDANSAPLMIGARSSSPGGGADNQFFGYIDEVAVYDHALSGSQVAEDYRLGAPTVPWITRLEVRGSDVVLEGLGGSNNTPYTLLATTNLALPFSDWTEIASNTFDAAGHFSVTNPADPAVKQQFYVVRVPAPEPPPVLNPLDALLAWFLNNPPDATGANFYDRWNHTALIDEYGWQLSTSTWSTYKSAWTSNPSLADSLEDAWPILYYLRQADLNAYQEIRNTVVTRGFVMWHIYNMGYIVKTRDKCFAIDIVARDSTSLVDLLDFAICSHKHTDHYDSRFLDAMVAAHKPVFSPFYSKGTVITSTSEYNFGEVNARFTMSHQQTDVPVIISQINLGTHANNYTIYDIADARPLTDLNPTRHINLFILHIQNSLNVFDAVDRVMPDATIYAHEMELGHAVGNYRWSYDYAYNKIQYQPHASSYVLTWGERIDGRY